MTNELANQHNQSDQALAQPKFQEVEFDLRELIIILWTSKVWIIGVTFIAAVLSVVIALSLQNHYRAEVLLATDEEGGGGGLAGLAAQYGGLASIAGISLPAGGSNEKVMGIAKLQSRQFISNFVINHDILPELMAANSFEWATGEVSFDESIYDAETGNWTRKAEPPLLPKPSLQEAYEEFRELLSISEDSLTGFVTVSIEHISPIVSERWVSWMVDDINQEMMLDAVDEAQQSIDYLTEQLRNTQIVALEEVFYSLIEEQSKTLMLANSRPQYIFKTIDPAIVPEEKYGPRRALICILGTILGGILGTLWVLIRHYIFRQGKVT